MEGQRWRRIEELFRAAALLDSKRRADLLERECAGDPELRREIEQLLEADEQGGASLAAAVSDAARDAVVPTEESHPERVGQYRLERELGSGGMGRVFLGVRDDDAFSKEVAVKLLTQGRFRPDLIQRFRTERQILATLEHPNIARLLDGGTTDGGDPYVVMEYVAGRSLYEHCDAAELSVRDRLELFSKICGAVQYAHDHAIVHRDLKPSNVLIAPTGEPKLLDFGIAKLLDTGVGVPVDETATSMRLMTPQYASPEQVRGEPVAAATDVYALGLMLYELLTGHRPYQVDGSDLTKIERAVCELDPPRPSRVVGRVAPGGTTSGLRRALAGDLDNIVLTALRKEPERRYASAGGLAADIRRHLEGRPVLARSATPAYRAAKFVRRKPALAALAVTLALTVPALGLLGVKVARQAHLDRLERTGTLLKETRWLQDRQRSEEALVKAEEILRLQPGHAAAVRHRAMAQASLAAGAAGEERDRLATAAAETSERLVELVPREAWPHAVRRYVMETLGRTAEAEAAAVRAEALRSGRRSDEDLDSSAQLALARGDHAAAVDLLSELISRSPDRPSAVSSRAFAYEELGRTEEAFIDYRVAIGIDPSQEGTLLDLARLSLERGDFDQAERYLERSFELRPESAYAHEARGRLLLARGLRAAGRGDIEAARGLLLQSERASRRSLEIEPTMRWAGLNVATTLLERSRLDPGGDVELLRRAAEQYRQALSGWRVPPARGEQRDLFYAALASRCDALIQLERLEEALGDCRRVTVLFPDRAVGFYNLAGVNALLGRHDEAIEALRRDVELGDGDWEYLSRDRWFESIRGRDEFARILEQMRRGSDGR